MSAPLVTLGVEVWTIMIGASVRGGILLLLAGVVTRFLPRTSAAQRHLVWALACSGALLFPALHLVVPAWRLRVLPAVTTPAVPTIATGVQARVPRVALPKSNTERPTSRPTPVPSRSVWFVLLIAVWGGGSLVVLHSLLRSQQRVWHLLSGTTPVSDPRVLALFTDVVRAAGLSRRVRLREHPSVIPMVCGVCRSTIVLPPGARGWTDSRLRHVLLHEAAHVKRYDGLVQTVASVACALYWFNPLVWFAARQLRIEREQACDDAVLIAESRPSAYATDLLALMHVFRGRAATSAAALTFVHAQRSQMHVRLRAIVDTAKRRTALSQQGVVAACGALMGVVCPLAGVTLVPRTVIAPPHVTTVVTTVVTTRAPVRPAVPGVCQGRSCTVEPRNTTVAIRKKNVVRHRGSTLGVITPAVPTPVESQVRSEMLLLSAIARMVDRGYATVKIEVQNDVGTVPSTTVIAVAPSMVGTVPDVRLLRAVGPALKLLSYSAATRVPAPVTVTMDRYQASQADLQKLMLLLMAKSAKPMLSPQGIGSAPIERYESGRWPD